MFRVLIAAVCVAALCFAFTGEASAQCSTGYGGYGASAFNGYGSSYGVSNYSSSYGFRSFSAYPATTFVHVQYRRQFVGYDCHGFPVFRIVRVGY